MNIPCMICFRYKQFLYFVVENTQLQIIREVKILILSEHINLIK